MKYLYVFIVFFICACEPARKYENQQSNLHFKTRDDSELFFKNVRQLYYEVERQKNTNLDIYRFKGRNKAQDQPMIHLAIVLNWRFDEAYLLVELNNFFEKDTAHILWQDKKGKNGNYLFKPPMNKEGHLRFALQIYESIMHNHQLLVRTPKNDLPLFSKKADSELFRKTVVDYLKLIGKL